MATSVLLPKRSLEVLCESLHFYFLSSISPSKSGPVVSSMTAEFSSDCKDIAVRWGCRGGCTDVRGWGGVLSKAVVRQPCRWRALWQVYLPLGQTILLEEGGRELCQAACGTWPAVPSSVLAYGVLQRKNPDTTLWTHNTSCTQHSSRSDSPGPWYPLQERGTASGDTASQAVRQHWATVQ